MRFIVIAGGLLLIVFGLACFNYAKPETVDHHVEFALEHGLPGPSDRIIWLGAGSLGAGAFVLGATVTRRRRGAKA